MKTESIVPIERIEDCIHLIRGQKVILDRDLAILYGIETKKLIQAVKRNLERFPTDFMFQLSKTEFEHWRSQIVTSNFSVKMGLRRAPYAFTQEGVAMLSSVLRSTRAVQVNIEIMRAFIRMRQILESNKELAKAVSEMRSFMLKNSNKVDQEFRRVWNAIEKLSAPPAEERRIGFRVE